jgi:hypothetical protein
MFLENILINYGQNLEVLATVILKKFERTAKKKKMLKKLKLLRKRKTT